MQPSKTLRYLLTCCLVGAACLSTARAATELDKLRELYKGEQMRAEEKQAVTAARAIEEYGSSLKDLEKQYQSAGELRPLLVVRKERQRFEQDQDVAAIRVIATPDKLKVLQEKVLEAHKTAGLVRARTIVDLSQKYTRRLRALERELTQAGDIDDAVAVMTEADSVNASSEIKWAKSLIAAGGAVSVRPAETPVAPVNTSSLGQVVRGEVIEWNSMTREIKCRYDFGAADQIEDWTGATLDDLRGRLSCDHSEAWSKPAFESIESVEYDAYFFTGDGHVALRIGQNLTCVQGAGPELGKNRTYQENEHFPLSETTGGVRAYVRYHCSLMLDSGSIRWTVNGKQEAGIRLRSPIRYPVQVGFGHESSKTMFDNITITGVLSQRYVDSVIR